MNFLDCIASATACSATWVVWKHEWEVGSPKPNDITFLLSFLSTFSSNWTRMPVREIFMGVSNSCILSVSLVSHLLLLYLTLFSSSSSESCTNWDSAFWDFMWEELTPHPRVLILFWLWIGNACVEPLLETPPALCGPSYYICSRRVKMRRSTYIYIKWDRMCTSHIFFNLDFSFVFEVRKMCKIYWKKCVRDWSPEKIISNAI